MTKSLKQHLLGIIYEEIEKSYNTSQKPLFKIWLNQLNNKKVISESLIAFLTNFKDNTQLYDMHTFIYKLINGDYAKDIDLDGDVLLFETPSFF